MSPAAHIRIAALQISKASLRVFIEGSVGDGYPEDREQDENEKADHALLRAVMMSTYRGVGA